MGQEIMSKNNKSKKKIVIILISINRRLMKINIPLSFQIINTVFYKIKNKENYTLHNIRMMRTFLS